MKLNYKRTICVGFAFFLICAFWQAYDNSIPMLLIHKFHMSQTASGAIMALDNVLALFMLPLFGSISDRCRSRWGRRTPFIVCGTVIAIVSFVLLPYVDPLLLFMVLLMISLVSMAVFRSPAVALMPDVTMKPLRSKANAVINLMGSVGGILVLVFGIVLGTANGNKNPDVFKGYFLVVAGVMAAALILFLLTVREPRFVKEMHAESAAFGIEEDQAGEGDGTQNSGGKRLSKEERRSMLFLLASIVMWFMGYNAAGSKFSVYATEILKRDYNLTLLIAQAAAIISYIPVGIIASRIGRKKTILAGVVLLFISFGTVGLLREDSSAVLMNAMFVLAGIAWATINVNSFPMVVEMCSGADIGKYTGIYYTASMAAQILTPVLSGYLMDRLGMTVLFPYTVVFFAISFFTMLQVRHGDSRPTAKTGLEALEDM